MDITKQDIYDKVDYVLSKGYFKGEPPYNPMEIVQGEAIIFTNFSDIDVPHDIMRKSDGFKLEVNDALFGKYLRLLFDMMQKSHKFLADSGVYFTDGDKKFMFINDFKSPITSKKYNLAIAHQLKHHFFEENEVTFSQVYIEKALLNQLLDLAKEEGISEQDKKDQNNVIQQLTLNIEEQKRNEDLSDMFAIELLTKNSEFKKYIAEYSGDLKKLSAKFGIPKDEIEMKILNIKERGENLG